jgi:transposase
MAVPLLVAPHLTARELELRYQQCKDVEERERLHCVLLKLKGRSSAEIAEFFMHREDWVRRTVRRYNAGGPEAMKDGRADNGAPRTLNDALMAELEARLEARPDDGGLWSGPKVAAWIRGRTGKPCADRTGWVYLVRAGYSLQRPRPKHPGADAEAQMAFKKGGLTLGFRALLLPIPEQTSRYGRWTKPGSG